MNTTTRNSPEVRERVVRLVRVLGIQWVVHGWPHKTTVPDTRVEDLPDHVPGRGRDRTLQDSTDPGAERKRPLPGQGLCAVAGFT